MVPADRYGKKSGRAASRLAHQVRDHTDMRPIDKYRVLVVVAALGLGAVVPAQQSPGVYTVSQAASGRAAYDETCATCHAADLKGSIGPPLSGSAFLAGWGSRTSSELLVHIKTTMPPGAEGSLADDQYLDIVAYVLQNNDHAAGDRPLRADSLVRLGNARGAQVAQEPAAPGRPAQSDVDDPTRVLIAGDSMPTTADSVVTRAIQKFTPVTQELL